MSFCFHVHGCKVSNIYWFSNKKSKKNNNTYRTICTRDCHRDTVKKTRRNKAFCPVPPCSYKHSHKGITHETITFRGSRRILSVSYDPLRGVLPTRDDHSLLPFSRGIHACSRGDDCAAEMFFSLFFLILFRCYFVIKRTQQSAFGLQKYT